MVAEPPPMPEKLPKGKIAFSPDQIGQISELSEKYLGCDAAEFTDESLLSNLRELYEFSLQKENRMSRRHAKQIGKLAILAASEFGKPNVQVQKEEAAAPRKRFGRLVQGMKEGLMAIKRKTSKKKQETQAADTSKASVYRQAADAHKEKGKFGKAGKNYEMAAGFATGYEKVELYSEADNAYRKAGDAKDAERVHKAFLEAAGNAERDHASPIRALIKFEKFLSPNVSWQLGRLSKMQEQGRFFDSAIRYSQILVDAEPKLREYIKFRSLLDQSLSEEEMSKFKRNEGFGRQGNLQYLSNEIVELKEWKLGALKKLHKAYSLDDQKEIEAAINGINAKANRDQMPMYTAMGTNHGGYLYTNISTSKIAKGGIRADRGFSDSPASSENGELGLEQYASRLGKIMKDGFKTSGRKLRDGILGVSYIHNLFGYIEPKGYASQNEFGAIVRWKPTGYCPLEYHGGIRGVREAVVLSPHSIKPNDMAILLKNPANASSIKEREWLRGLADELWKKGISFEYALY